MNSMWLTSSSAATCVDSALKASCTVLSTSGLSSLNRYRSSRRMIGICSLKSKSSFPVRAQRRDGENEEQNC